MENKEVTLSRDEEKMLTKDWDQDYVGSTPKTILFLEIGSNLIDDVNRYKDATEV